MVLGVFLLQGSNSLEVFKLFQLAFAFELTGDEAMDYLASAGIALKPTGEDLVYKVCFEKELYDFEIVNYLLKKRGFGPLVELEELQDPPMDR